jgi:hypothetical protein
VGCPKSVQKSRKKLLTAGLHSVMLFMHTVSNKQTQQHYVKK